MQRFGCILVSFEQFCLPGHGSSALDRPLNAALG
jgi:hypothetical protein